MITYQDPIQSSVLMVKLVSYSYMRAHLTLNEEFYLKRFLRLS
ncbi:MAG: hypothetical protein ACJAYK_002295 [Crocinitomicaceae bacterium]|jgi:hypothetical protein